MKKQVLTLFILLTLLLWRGVGGKATAQNKFNMRIKITAEGKSARGASLNITENNKPFRQVVFDTADYYPELRFGNNYVITCSKQGYITKTVTVDTRIPKGREGEEFAKFNATIVLNKEPKDTVETYLHPVGKIEYSKEKDDFDFDKNEASYAMKKTYKGKSK